MLRLRAQFVFVAAAAAGLAIQARAAERVTLSNGFAQVCDHHEVVEGKYRLYTSKAPESYIEFPGDQIASIEWVPEPPPEPVAPPVKAAAPAGAPAVPAKSPVTEARLTPADLHQMLASAGNAHNVDEDLLASVVK